MTRYGSFFLIRVEELAAESDDPAGYLATNDELGLVVEADSLDALKTRISEIAPELYELNIRPNLTREAARSDLQQAGLPKAF